jgi:hypothetical protein
MKRYNKFVRDYCNEGGLGFIEEDVETLIQHLDIYDDTSDNLQMESLSSVVNGVTAGIAIKTKSLLSKLRSEKDAFEKQNILGQMILLSTYGSLVAAAAGVKNQSMMRKLVGKRIK